MSLLWINGQLVDKADARVSPFDHGFLYGDGVWEHFRVFGGKLFRPDQHIDELYKVAAGFGLDVPMPRDELKSAVEATVRANARTEGYGRVIVSRGPGTLGPDPRKIDPQVFIIVEEYHPFPLELYDHGLHAVTMDGCDMTNMVHVCRTLGQRHLVTAKQHALSNGCLEAILLFSPASRRVVSSGTEGRLFLVRQGKLLSVFGMLPERVMLDVVAELVGAAGIPIAGIPGVIVATDLRELLAADEVFLAGTSCGVIGIVRVDGQDIGPGTEGPVTRQIREAYRKLTHGT